MPARRIVTALAVVAAACTACTATTTNGHGSAAPRPTISTPSSVSSAPPVPTSGPVTGCDSDPNGCNAGTARQGGSITYALDDDLLGWNAFDFAQNTVELDAVLSGVLPSAFVSEPDYGLTINSDLLVSATSSDGTPQTVTYKINPKATWNDGTPVGPDDFKYAWQVGVAQHASGYTDIASVSGAGDTVGVRFKTRVADWQSLFSTLYPAHVAAQHGSVAASTKWLGTHAPTYSAGPYQLAPGATFSSVSLVRNTRWWGTQAKLDKVTFQVIPVDAQPNALTAGEAQVIYPVAPTTDLYQHVHTLSDVRYQLDGSAFWEHLDIGTSNPLLRDAALRKAIFTAVDAKQLATAANGPMAAATKLVANHMLIPGQAGYVDTLTPTGQGTGNVAKAQLLLRQAGYRGVGTALRTKAGKAVRLKCEWTNDVRRAECLVIQAQLRKLGITITPKQTTDLANEAYNRKFDLLIFSWGASAAPGLTARDLWSAYFGPQQAAAVRLIDQACAASSTAAEASLLDHADVLLTQAAYVLPLFQRPSLIAYRSDLVNVRDNTTASQPTYNVADWGVRS